MKRAVFFGVLAASAGGLLFACGARTELLVPDQQAADTGPDVHKKKDVGPDVEDAEPDVQGLDVAMLDANKNDCPDASSTLVYVVTNTDQLLSFYPPDATFSLIGTLKCPAKSGTHPFSMAVNRKGTAFVVYDSGELFQVSTADASCKATSFVSGQMGFSPTFGMGLRRSGPGPAEQLFVASDPTTGASLATIDTTTFNLSTVGFITPTACLPELTGTGDGRLYGFYSPDPSCTSMTMAVGEFDKMTGKIVGADALPSVDRGNGWAFAFWGGDFWLFTGPGGTQRTTKYDPVTKSLSLVAQYSSLIVGAGVSTCAPQ